MFCHDRDFKYRICPPQPLAYGDWRERYQGARVANPGITRAGLTKIASESRRRGKPIEAPSGSNCLDLEVYTVKPDHHLTIRGTKKIKVPCADVFPLVEGIFGPLRIPLPRTPCILDAEYGSLWRQTWTVKKHHKRKSCNLRGTFPRQAMRLAIGAFA